MQQGPAASSTPVQWAKPIRRSSGLGAVAAKEEIEKENCPIGSQQNSLEQIKRAKWQTDLQKVMKLLLSSTIATAAGIKKEKSSAKVAPAKEPAIVQPVVVMTSSKRRIIPKQRISV